MLREIRANTYVFCNLKYFYKVNYDFKIQKINQTTTKKNWKSDKMHRLTIIIY